MTPTTNQPQTADQPATYEIKVQGRLDERWSNWFDQMTITFDNGNTVFNGAVTDQTALHGIFVKIRDLNLTLISVNRIETNPKD